MSLFPAGITHYLLGGLLIGAGVAGIYLCTGLVAGASSFFSSTLSWLSARECFRSPRLLGSRTWRVVFTAGLIGGALAFTLALRHGEPFVTSVQPWRLVLGGFLVVGTRLSRGCTSGHGICGLASWSRASLGAVLTFIGVGVAVALCVQHAGIAP
jgi:uncharacterized membrane protein YedE/YeeE